MNKFIQLHFLTSYPPSNLNRDDLGRPKTAMMGGVNRLRVSSQSLKRAWRTSDLFQSALDNHIGIRTKRMGREIYEKLIKGGILEKDSFQWARLISQQFGKMEEEEKNNKNPEKETSKKDRISLLETNQLVHFNLAEQKSISDLIVKCISERKHPSNDDLQLLRKESRTIDIASFGRMMANNPDYNVDAAIQVAHALTTHGVEIEDDYFSAIDDLNDGSENAGSAHIGENEFASGVFYNYICIDKNILLNNLGRDKELLKKTVSALIETVCKVSPTGKQNSFASRCYTSYMLAERGNQQPRSLSVAFLKPIREKDILQESINSLIKVRDNFNKIFGNCCNEYISFNSITGEGSLKELIENICID